MSTALTTQNNALQHLNVAEGERAYLLAIMAEQLGIPARDSQRPDVQALIANAVERNREYGWKPGVHMHVQSFNQKVKNDKNQDTGETIKKYTLVDGEKSWKDSLAQWRIQHGVNTRYQRKPMSRDELEAEVKSMGCDKPIPANAAGIWCRVIIMGEDDPKDPDFPMWSGGVWFGFSKAGTWWNVDGLPTGVTPRDVAIRRADKRSAMQSSLTLIPVDARTPEQRSNELTESLRHEASYKASTMPQDTAQSQRFVVEPTGDILYATEPERPAPRASTDTVDDDVEFREGVPEEVDGESTESENESTVDNPFEEEGFSPYAEMITNEDFMISDVTKDKINELHELQATSTRRMSSDGYKMLRERFMQENVIFDGQGAFPPLYFFEAMTATHLEEVPGVKVGKPLMEMLANDGDMAILKQVSVIVDSIYQDMRDG